jgi:hypothetical protein
VFFPGEIILMYSNKGSNYTLCLPIQIHLTQHLLKYDEYSDSIPPQNYDWMICLLAKTVSKGKINEPLLYSFDGKCTSWIIIIPEKMYYRFI